MLRSAFSGVPQEVGAAYAALAPVHGALLELIAAQRLGGQAREPLLAFTSKLARIADRQSADEALPEFIESLFDLENADGDLATPEQQRFELRASVEREEGEPLRAERPRFSASQLNTYVECPRKWFYRYLCNAVEDKGSAASYYGIAFHRALEHFHAAYPRPGDASPDELRLKLEGFLNAAFSQDRARFETAVEHELQRRRALRTGRKYVEWLCAEARRAPFTVVGCELSAELQLEGYDFVGFIDRLDRDDQTGSVTVLDYKTGTIAASASQYREQVRAFKDFQLPFYYWARTAQGDRVTRLALIPLKDALLDVSPVALEVIPVPAPFSGGGESGVIPIAELERARTRMIEICAELTSGTKTSFAVTADADACAYCTYAIACAGKPIPLEDHFSR